MGVERRQCSTSATGIGDAPLAASPRVFGEVKGAVVFQVLLMATASGWKGATRGGWMLGLDGGGWMDAKIARRRLAGWLAANNGPACPFLVFGRLAPARPRPTGSDASSRPERVNERVAYRCCLNVLAAVQCSLHYSCL